MALNILRAALFDLSPRGAFSMEAGAGDTAASISTPNLLFRSATGAAFGNHRTARALSDRTAPKKNQRLKTKTRYGTANARHRDGNSLAPPNYHGNRFRQAGHGRKQTGAASRATNERAQTPTALQQTRTLQQPLARNPFQNIC